MQKQTLVRSIAEAERFLAAAKKAKKELSQHYFPSGKVLAACKRASMDLSRCLADLRQNR